MSLDKMKGALYGVAIGDALGAPFEFQKATPKIKYTGILSDIDVSVRFQFATMTILASSITDDTEMTIQLLKGLIENNGIYDEDIIIKKYLEWANLKSTPLGKNTRALMKGVNTVKGFRKRQLKIDTTNVQSNGSLMRCLPIAFLDNWKEASDMDVSLTNDNLVNKECSFLYLSMLRFLIFNEPMNIKCKETEVKNAIKSALDGDYSVDVSINKGWVVHALYVSIITLFNTSSFDDGMDYIAKHFIKGDTDTIMAITGGLLGAFYGFEKLINGEKSSINIEKLDNYFETTDRPKFTDELFDELLTFIS